jgi:fructosamine-3-kinase
VSARRYPFAVISLTPVSGGDLNDAFRADLPDGRTVFMKTSDAVLEGAFAAEAGALAWIAAAEGAPPVPEVIAVTGDQLWLSWVESGHVAEGGEEAFGRALAALHRAGSDAFGDLPPGVRGGLRIGPLRLPISAAESGPELYRDDFLLPLVLDAAARGALSDAGVRAVERVCGRIGDLAGPPEPPARLHGDLWSGNALPGADGRIYLLDPAAYAGHREVDLAMMALFGGFSDRCFAAYDEAFALSEGWRDRVGLWQLAPLLIHAVLFGGGYGARVEAIARHYAG